jgi:uncharacterized protein (DUF362 family)
VSADGRTGRREALRRIAIGGGLSAAASGGAYWLSRRNPAEEPVAARFRTSFTVPEDANRPELVVARGESPRALVRGAIGELGGIGRFIARGDAVVVKPNVSWDRTPAQAANTNPDVVAEVVRLCLEAGAKQVVVTDVSINNATRCFGRSGIGAAASGAGAKVVLPESGLFRDVDLRGRLLGVWPVLEPFLNADKLINLPIAKHHSLSRVTLGMKAWYGLVGGNRQRLHQRMDEALADLAAFVRPTLTLIDCWRVLMHNGPTGGSIEDVRLAKTLVAATDAVAADAWVAREFWNLEAAALPYLALAKGRGLGTFDLGGVRMREVNA